MKQHSIALFRCRSVASTLGLLGIVSLGGACQKERAPEPAPTTAKPAAPPPAPPAAAPAKAKPAPKPLIKENVVWEDPSGWKRLERSGMRYASYEIPPAKGDKAPGVLNVFILGGDIDANIQRWVDEFSGMDPKSIVRTRRTVNELTQALVEVPKGHFNGGMGDTGPSDNYGLLGAIVVAPSGAEYFFKLTGPSKTVKAARKSFYAMLDSVRVENPAPEAKPAAAATTATAPADGKPAPAGAPPAAAQAAGAKPAESQTGKALPAAATTAPAPAHP